MSSRDRNRKNEVNRRWYANMTQEKRDMHNQRSKDNRKRRGVNQLAARKSRTKYNFGEGAAEYKEARIDAQKNRCAICFCLLIKPCLDHNHETDQWRDVLCMNCNFGLGCFKENLANFKSAMAYLKKHAILPQRNSATKGGPETPPIFGGIVGDVIVVSSE